MPSHIFLQLGMWDRVVNSNIEAFAAAVSNNKKLGLREGGEDFHTLSWLAYANLMLGHFDRAQENLAIALATVERNPDDNRVLSRYLNMRARYIIETGDCEESELKSADSNEGQHTAWVTALGMCAAKNLDMETATEALTRLSMKREKTRESGESYKAFEIEIHEKELGAIIKMMQGEFDQAVVLAREASSIELENMSAPSGPPIPMKPAAEMYGEILAAAGRYDEAVNAFKAALNWVPNRTPSILGLSIVAAKNGDMKLAREMEAKLQSTPGINSEKFTASL
jgi:tetratricopeptide (TPR) repeat protein